MSDTTLLMLGNGPDGPEKLEFIVHDLPPHGTTGRRHVLIVRRNKRLIQTLDPFGRWVDVPEGSLWEPHKHGIVFMPPLDDVELGRVLRNWLALIDATSPVGKFIWTWVRDEIRLARKESLMIRPADVQVTVALMTALQQLGLYTALQEDT